MGILYDIIYPYSKRGKMRLEKIFNNKENFSQEIEKLVSEGDTSYIDAVINYCSENDIEYKLLNKLIDGPLKAKIEVEARDKNYLDKVNKLPI